MSLDTMFAEMKVTPAPSDGTWHAIQLCPNPAADERINVGVVYLAGGRTHFRLLENMAGLKCLYGSKGLDNAQFLLSLVRDTLAAGELASPAPQILIGPAGHATGDQPDAVVDRIFQDIVTVGRHRTELELVPAVDTPTVRNSTVRRKVVSEMAKISAAVTKRVFAEKPFKVKAPDHKEHELDIPLRTSNRFGSIVSAAYKSATPRRNGLLGAFMDLSTARLYVDAKERGKLFILREEAFPESLQREIDNDVDEIGWRLKKIKIEVDQAFTPKRLAKDIVAWAQ
jgi:hypothetical protein